jgi:alkylation response protein AidB-like acyl-CoA dehydrogenase
MISFGPTEEQELVRDTLREFAQKEIRPLARECDETATIPDAVLDATWSLGLTSTQIPEVYGGAGEPRSPVTNVLALEELAVGDAALALAAVAPSSFAYPVLDLGTDEQKKTYLPLFCGERFHAASLALVEPSPVFDALDLRTVAEPKGDTFVLSGRKSFVVLGDRASHFLVVARSTAREGFAGLDAFIVPRDAKGLEISGIEKNLGLRGLPTVSLVLDRVEVPAANRLGGEAGIDARRLLASSRVGLSAVMLGLSRAVMDYAIPYAKDRIAFGEAIARRQTVAFWLSDMRIEIDSMRWLLWQAASSLEGGRDATRTAHLARAYAAEASMKIADDGLQVLGGHGFIREHPVELWYRSARTLGVLEGTVAV